MFFSPIPSTKPWSSRRIPETFSAILSSSLLTEVSVSRVPDTVTTEEFCLFLASSITADAKLSLPLAGDNRKTEAATNNVSTTVILRITEPDFLLI